MATEAQPKHKPGPLKQKNKQHKHGRHRTKGQIENTNKGKVDVKALSRKSKTLDKRQKRHQAKQIRKNKRDETMEKKRRVGTEHTPPRVIAVFPLSQLCSCEEAVSNIIESDDSILSITKEHSQTIISTRHRQRFTILTPNPRDLFEILDAGKASDSSLFVVPADGNIGEYNQKWMTYLIAQGLPSTIFAIQGLKHVPIKKQSDTKKNITKQLEKWFPEVKLHPIDSQKDAGLVLRLLANQKQKPIFYREKRPYMLVDHVQMDSDNAENVKGTLKISGYIRGKQLSVNRLIHLPGLGDFQMKQIDLPSDPYTIRKKQDKNSMEEEDDSLMEEDLKVIATSDPSKQMSLVTEAEVDPMEGEQTWPTEEELLQADEEAQKVNERKQKKVPKGTSEYQAAWIVDENDDDEEEEDDEDSDSEDMHEVADAEDEEESEHGDEYDTISIAASTVINDAKYDEDFDMDEEQKQLEKYRLERENEMFPDEVDTPMHMPASERFQRYRCLKSFRTSPWDPKENLPLDYARIFQFQNFNRTKKKILKEDDEESDSALPGWYVTIHVCGVPKTYVETWNPKHAMLVFGLLPHEQKMTVMNFAIKRHPTCNLPIKAKDRLIFHVGYRRFISCPIFSQHTTGDKFKAERFLPHSDVVIATVYAPIMFPPAPVLVFTEEHQLVATGSVLGSNPDRIIVKKIVLSGHPFKINKKSSVVRYMFFNREDILWFKPVELSTKYGRRGHIKEPLGTHGHMKCVFDGQLKAQDTICMNLFKRIYPKWIYEPSVAAPVRVPFEAISEDIEDTDM